MTFNRELSQRQLEAAAAMREAAKDHIPYRAPTKRDSGADRKRNTAPSKVVSISVEEYLKCQ